MSIGHRGKSMGKEKSFGKAVREKALVHMVDGLAYVVSLLSLLFTLDQVRIVWIDHNVSGVSGLSWSFYAVSAFVWFCYGLLHKDKVLIITNLLWTVFSLFVVVGVVLYQ